MADTTSLPVPTPVPSDPVRVAPAPDGAAVQPRFKRLVVFTGKLS